MLASAHEVYVLTSGEVAKDLTYPPINLFAAAVSHKYLFLSAALAGIFLVICILGVSLSRKLEARIDPILFKIKPYAASIAQATLGLALLASAYYGALFGTEVSIAHLFGAHAKLVLVLLYIAGSSIILGIYPRIGGALAVIIYISAICAGEGVYMLSYLTYFGEGLVILLFSGGYGLLRYRIPLAGRAQRLMDALAKRKHFIMRICFSASLIYAALYAKLIHGTLALNTVAKYHLTNYFHFDPIFVVLGAFIIELLIGLFYLIGFELRFTSLLFLMFLTMSLVFFGEAVWPHIILIGTAITIFAHGYDEYTVLRPWYEKGAREPIF